MKNHFEFNASARDIHNRRRFKKIRNRAALAAAAAVVVGAVALYDESQREDAQNGSFIRAASLTDPLWSFTPPQGRSFTYVDGNIFGSYKLFIEPLDTVSDQCRQRGRVDAWLHVEPEQPKGWLNQWLGRDTYFPKAGCIPSGS